MAQRTVANFTDRLEKVARTEIPKPTTQNPPPRHKCPFHGFVGVMGAFISVGTTGNACGLVGGHSPCRMQVNGETPTAGDCQVVRDNAEILKEIIPNPRVRVVAQEFKPADCSEWQGIPLKDWVQYIEAETTPRPQTVHA